MNDKTLKEQLAKILSQSDGIFKFAHAHGVVYKGDNQLDQIMQLIQQDRERAVREELEIMIDHYTPYRPFLDDDKSIDIRSYCTNRLTELSNPTQEESSDG